MIYISWFNSINPARKLKANLKPSIFYSKSLHDLHKQHPLAPEKSLITRF